MFDHATAPLIVAFPAPTSPDVAITHCEWLFYYANAVIDPATSASLEYPQLLRGADAPN
jgi:hypothetical protein